MRITRGCTPARPLLRRFFPFFAQEDGAGEPELETFDGPLRERLAEPAVERAVKKRFARFLHRYTPPNAEPSGRLYRHQLLDLCLGACLLPGTRVVPR